jgi:flavin reductase (DIM6/NTAB) family NADH-FMN oxidoreductase RutF
MHRIADPAILYFGTPAALISTLNEDGSPNLAPMSSAWWLSWRCVLGLGLTGQTAQNLLRERECVVNLPSADMVAAVNRLALLTGANPVPEPKARRGYRHERDKFGVAGLTPVGSDTVAPPRVLECPVQLEATVVSTQPLAAEDPIWRGKLVSIEVRVTRAHLEESILMDDDGDRVDPDKWRPLIMSFQHFYGLAPQRLHESTLARIPESMYRAPKAPPVTA